MLTAWRAVVRQAEQRRAWAAAGAHCPPEAQEVAEHCQELDWGNTVKTGRVAGGWNSY